MGRTDWLEKTPILGKIEARRRRGWQRIRLDGHEFEQAPGDGEGQRSLASYSPWGHRELDMTGQLNNNNKSMSAFASPRFLMTWEKIKFYIIKKTMKFMNIIQKSIRNNLSLELLSLVYIFIFSSLTLEHIKETKLYIFKKFRKV